MLLKSIALILKCYNIYFICNLCVLYIYIYICKKKIKIKKYCI